MAPARRLRPTYFVAAVALVAVAWWAVTYWVSEERRVRGRLESLAEVLNERAAGELGMMSRTAQLAAYLTENAALDPGRGRGVLRGRERLLALASRAPSDLAEFRVAFVDVTVTVTGDSARSRLTATLTTRARPEEAPTVDAREVDLQWRREDAWRIERITLVDPLERPEGP